MCEVEGRLVMAEFHLNHYFSMHTCLHSVCGSVHENVICSVNMSDLTGWQPTGLSDAQRETDKRSRERQKDKAND
jgi:hypothetical protein